MKVITLQLGAVCTNTYIVFDDDKNAVIIDPADSPEEIIKVIENYDVKPLKIVLTHGHFDHILAAEDLSVKYGISVFVHKDDEELLSDNEKNLFKTFGMCGKFKPVTDITVYNDGDIIKAGSLTFKIMHTPGHTKGSCTLICGDCLFTGDTLFSGSVGRTDMYGGNYDLLKKSLERFKTLEGDYKIYTGHGQPSTLSRELKANIYLVDIDEI